MSRKALRVDKGIPIPPIVIKQGCNVSLLQHMEDGDSIHWPPADEKKALRFYRVAKKLKLKILVRKVGADDPNGVGVRMWRLGAADD